MKETYIIRTIECSNGIVEKVKFPVRMDPNSLKTRESRREIDRQAKNTSNSARNFARILNNNFVSTDHFLTVTLSTSGMQKIMDRAASIASKMLVRGLLLPCEKDLLHLAMERELENWNRRTLTACKKAGVEFKYAAAVSDIEYDDGVPKDARLHIHAVVNKESSEIYKKKWTFGRIHDEPLGKWKDAITDIKTAQRRRVADWTRLANYIIGQSRTIENGKRYTISRNLDKPDRKPDRIAKNPYAELRPPKGAILLERGKYVPGWPQYIRYKLPRADDDDDDREEAE